MNFAGCADSYAQVAAPGLVNSPQRFAIQLAKRAHNQLINVQPRLILNAVRQDVSPSPVRGGPCSGPLLAEVLDPSSQPFTALAAWARQPGRWTTSATDRRLRRRPTSESTVWRCSAGAVMPREPAGAPWVIAPWQRGYAPSPLPGPFDVENLVATSTHGSTIWGLSRSTSSVTTGVARSRTRPARLRRRVCVARSHSGCCIRSSYAHAQDRRAAAAQLVDGFVPAPGLRAAGARA
jgi:hypothetical protein